MDLIDEREKKLIGIYYEDIPDDEDTVREMPINVSSAFTSITEDMLAGRCKLINRESSEDPDDLLPFGNESKRSLSLMFAPIQWEHQTIGFLSIQSYTPNRYDQSSLDLLYSFADQCSGALVRAKIQDSLRKSKERYQQFFEDDLTGDYISTPDDHIQICNPAFARIFGFSSVEEALQCNVRSLYPHPKDRDTFLDKLKTEKKIVRYELELRTIDGKPVHVIENVLGHFDENEELAEIQGYIFDITARKKMEIELRQAQKMEAIGNLAGGIAHDFNNIIMAINGYAGLVLETLNENDPRREDISQILLTAKRGSNLTRQLLTFSRKQAFQPEVMDLNAVIHDLEKMLRRLIGEDVDLKTVLDPNPCFINADKGQMEQVIINLAVNARDAMPGVGQLVIETNKLDIDLYVARNYINLEPGNYIVLSVSDSGIGMDKTTLSHIFEPFYTTKEQGKGTGLGLSTVFGIIKQCGGDIRVYSEPGQGSTFKIFLPCVNQNHQLQKDETSPTKCKGTETILVVEDDANVRQIVAKILSKHGYKIVKATHGMEAMRIAEQSKETFHLIITDMVMPQMDGMELAQRLALSHPRMKVLYMSGYTNLKFNPHEIEKIGQHFIHKPFSTEDLLHKVRKVLDYGKE